MILCLYIWHVGAINTNTVTNVSDYSCFFPLLFNLLHSVITAGLNLFRVFGGTAKTALKKCPWISVTLVLTGEQHMLLFGICNYREYINVVLLLCIPAPAQDTSPVLGEVKDT